MKKTKKVNNYNNYEDWVSDVLKSEKNGIKDYLKIAFEEFAKDGDEKAFLIILRQIAKAQGGFNELSKSTGIKRESLYRALSADGNPRLKTLTAVLDTLGYSLSLVPRKY